MPGPEKWYISACVTDVVASAFQFPQQFLGGEDMGLQFLQDKGNPPANPNPQSVEPGLSPAREDLVSSFIKHRRKVCREVIKRYPQPGCTN